jgi:hypothetical protein
MSEPEQLKMESSEADEFKTKLLAAIKDDDDVRKAVANALIKEIKLNAGFGRQLSRLVLTPNGARIIANLQDFGERFNRMTPDDVITHG